MSLREPSMDQLAWTGSETGGTLADAVLYLLPDGTVIDLWISERATLPGHEALIGARLTDLLDTSSRAQLQRALTALAEGNARRASAQIILPGSGGGTPVLVIPQNTEDGITLLCLDQTPVMDAVARADRVQAALEAASDEERTARGVQSAVFAHLDEALVVVDAVNGRILDLSKPAGALLGTSSDTSGPMGGNTAFTQCFEGRRRSEFIENLCAAATANRSIRAELRGGRGTIVVRPKMSRAQDLTLLICTLEPVDEAESGGDARGFAGLSQGSPDGMVCLNAQGTITEANPAFLRMVAATGPSEIEGRPIVSFLLRGAIDLRAMTEPRGPANFATRIVGLTGQRTPVEITVSEMGGDSLGLVLRDITLADITRPTGDAPTPEGQTRTPPEPARQVGTVPLRDIVAGMTDIVERDCVEAAIALTQNNRVAAAEMLGLSRQSLYVKLRKFGLLDKGDQDGPA